MYYVGLDVHQSRSSLHILNENGAAFKHFEIKGPWPELIKKVKELPRPLQVCYEASCGYGHLYDQLAPLAEKVAVAHPGHLRLIFRAKKKNDRVDSQKIAKLLYLDAVPQIHVPKAEVRAWRRLINFRRRLVTRRTAVKNEIQAFLRDLGVKAPRCLWTVKGQAWLKELALPGAADQLRRDLLQDELQLAHGRIKAASKELNRIGLRHAGVRLLMTIPGVGIRTAEAMVAYIDDIRRFGAVREVSSYFGVVPCQDQSADKNRLGHITCDGPAAARWLLGEAAWQGIRRSPTIRAFHQRVMRGDADRKKLALVATMNYLVRVMAAMLRTGEAWRESPVATDRPQAAGALPQTPPPAKDGLRPAVNNDLRPQSQPRPRP